MAKPWHLAVQLGSINLEAHICIDTSYNAYIMLIHIL